MTVEGIKDWQQILKFVLVIVTSEIIFLIVWQVCAPLKAATKTVDTLAYNELYIYCKSKSNDPTIVFLFLNMFLLAPAVFICWLTRTVPEKYNESSMVSLIAAASAIIGLIVIGLTLMFPDFILALYAIPTIGMALLIILIYCLLFLPKIFYIHEIWQPTTSGSVMGADSGSGRGIVRSTSGHSKDDNNISYRSGRRMSSAHHSARDSAKSSKYYDDDHSEHMQEKKKRTSRSAPVERKKKRKSKKHREESSSVSHHDYSVSARSIV
jgi:hypothetical protein